KRQVVVGHGDSAVGVPGSACSYGDQSAASIRENRSGIGEVQYETSAKFQRLGKNHSYQVVTATRELTALDGFVLQKLQRRAVHIDSFDLQIAGELKQHNSRAALPGFDLEGSL